MLKAFFILISLLNPDSLFEKEIDLYLQSNLTNYVKYEYEVVRMPKDFKEIKINRNQSFTITGDLAYVPVTVVKKSNDTFNTSIVLKVNLFTFALIANDDIQRNAELNESQFRTAIIDVTKFRDEPILNQDLQSLRSKFMIEKDSPLLKNMVEEKPVIQAGDVVWLNTRVGMVNIKMSATARQEGKVDEIIRVKSDDNKLYRAKVLDNNNVLVME